MKRYQFIQFQSILNYLLKFLFSNLKPEEILVRCGDWDITDDYTERLEHQDRKVNSVSIHPLYTEGRSDDLKLYNDVGIVHTKEAFDIKPNVNTICLPDSVTDDNFSKNDCHTMGWGTLNDKEPDNIIQNYMKKVVLNRVDFDECNSILKVRNETKNSFKLHSSFICAGGEKEKDVCKGDGGGPLVCQQQGDPNKYVFSFFFTANLFLERPNLKVFSI